jgi:hypothetical protein
MRQNRKKLVGLSIIAIVVGVFLVVGAYVISNGKIGIYIAGSGIHYKYKNNSEGMAEEFLLEEFQQVDIRYEDVDIKFCIADDYGISYELDAGELAPVINVEEGILKITKPDQEVHINIMDFDWKRNTMIIYYPEDTSFEEIKADISSGDINIQDMIVKNMVMKVEDGSLNIQKGEIGELDIDIANGNVTIGNVNAENIYCKILEGNHFLTNINIESDIILDNVFGKIELENIIAEYLNIKAIDSRIEAEEIYLQGLDIKKFSTSAIMFGELNGKSNISSTDGDVKLRLIGEYKDYNYSIEVMDGEVSLEGKKEAQKLEINNNAENSISIDTRSGNVKIDYEN